MEVQMKQDKKGFSLVELLIVLTIIGALISVALPNLRAYQTNSKIDSVKPTLVYIADLFKLTYAANRSFGGLEITNVNPNSLPKKYCIKVYSAYTGDLATKFAYNDSDILNYSRKQSKSCARSCKTKMKSGFMIVAYGKNSKLDVALDHNGNFYHKGSKANPNVPNCSKFPKKGCTSYSNRSECRAAGCNLIGSECTAPHDLS